MGFKSGGGIMSFKVGDRVEIHKINKTQGTVDGYDLLQRVHVKGDDGSIWIVQDESLLKLIPPNNIGLRFWAHKLKDEVIQKINKEINVEFKVGDYVRANFCGEVEKVDGQSVVLKIDRYSRLQTDVKNLIKINNPKKYQFVYKTPGGNLLFSPPMTECYFDSHYVGCCGCKKVQKFEVEE